MSPAACAEIERWLPCKVEDAGDWDSDGYWREDYRCSSGVAGSCVEVTVTARRSAGGQVVEFGGCAPLTS